MKQTRTHFRPTPCLADHPIHLKHTAAAAVAAALHIWEMHVGTVHLFIVGPGADAWLRCSEACYTGQIGTDVEREIARRAVIILNREQLENKDAGPAEIRAALDRARRETLS